MAEKQEMKTAGNKKNAVNIRISEDWMSAWLQVEPPPDGKPLDTEEIRYLLRENGVKQGILTENLNKVFSGKLYRVEVLIAEGRAAVDGENGRFEFLVNTEAPAKPVELPDGSVDYSNMELFVPVTKGQLLVRYHRATRGSFGFLINGQLVSPKQGKDLPQMKGSGFDLSEDKTEYSASYDGYIDYQNERLTVSRVFTVKGDLDMTVGNILFSGDVEVKGDVAKGMRIEAGGKVIISGHVSGASIVAGEDVILKSGMQGEGIGRIQAGGSVTGKFMEAAIVECGGDLQVNYMLNCYVSVAGKVTVSGRKGVIIGGKVQARHGITAAEMGNTAEIPTMLMVGPGEEMREQLLEQKKEIRKLEEEIDLLIKGKQKIEEAPPQVREKNKLLYDRALTAIAMKQAGLEEVNAKAAVISEQLISSQKAKITASGKVFPGVIVWVAMRKYVVQDTLLDVCFVYQDENIATVRNA